MSTAWGEQRRHVVPSLPRQGRGGHPAVLKAEFLVVRDQPRLAGEHAASPPLGPGVGQHLAQQQKLLGNSLNFQGVLQNIRKTQTTTKENRGCILLTARGVATQKTSEITHESYLCA